MNICTIIAKNYLAHARVLARSFQEHHPDGRCFVLIIDEVDGYVDATAESFTLVAPREIGVDDFDEMRGAYDVMELSTAVKPWLLRWMLDHHDDGSGVAYMDPDIQVISRMVELEAELTAHAVVLTPHVLHGMPRDGLRPSETDILMAGVYNLGFIGVSGRDDARLVLDWWSERLLTDCHVAPERGLFVDQRWVDFVPGLISDLRIFRHPAYNVAYWNLPERSLERRDGTYHAGGEPLRFFHYSGYDPTRRDVLSKHQNRVSLTAGDGALRQICDDYGDALEAAGIAEVRTFPYEHDILPSGRRITKLMRSLYRVGIEAGEAPDSLFTRAGEAEFLAWLSGPAPEMPELSRLYHGLWSLRSDLQAAYPDPAGVDRDGFVGWCEVWGRPELGGAGPELSETTGDAAAPAADDATAAGTTPADAAPATTPEHDAPDALGTVRRVNHAYGVNVAGYLRSELGIGEVARQVISALDAAGVHSLPVGVHTPHSRQGHGYVTGGAERNPFPVNLVCVNADQLPVFAADAGEAFFARRYTIGLWWWETSEFPEQYHRAFEHVDEVWAGSRFIAEAIAAVSPVPVIHVPIPVAFRTPAPLKPGELGWPDAFTFLFSWDYNSVFARKNPLATVAAYCAAFTEDDGTALVLKCINAEADPVNHRRVLDAAAGRRDIVVMDAYVDPPDKDRLMSSCDCYVSLHRSEGLGLTMAEAMFHGRPVVATGYSGNADFMDAGNSFPVGYELVPIGDDAGPYPATGTWAEPDVAQAARLLRHVFDDRADAAAKGAKAAADMRERYSAPVAGAAMAARLATISTRIPPAPAPAPDGRLDQAGLHETRRLLRRGVRPDRPSRYGKPGGAARRIVLRAMRPFTAYQLQMNAALEHGMSSIAAQVEATAARADVTAEQVDVRATESHAVTLSQLRTQSSQIVDLAAAVSRLSQEIAAEQVERAQGLDGATRLVAETRAIPYMASDVFTTFDAGAAGSVFGYSTPLAAGDEDAYREFEELFRGSEEFIADRQRRYLDVIGECAPVVDVGCGRGEFLDVLAAAGIDATGVDSDAGMVARCRAKGHEQTVLADGIEYLESLEDGSLGLVFSAQVVEHMPPDALRRFLEVAMRKLRPGGMFVAETVNPHSVPALKTFWVDITHQHPLFPEVMLALARITGFGEGYVFHPNGVGDVETDRFTTGEYALVARR